MNRNFSGRKWQKGFLDLRGSVQSHGNFKEVDMSEV